MTNARKIAPDILKIMASVFVVVIHHKDFAWPSFTEEYIVVHAVLLLACIFVGFCIYRKERMKGATLQDAVSRGIIPLYVWIGFFSFKKFPVTVFILLSSYFMGVSLSKTDKPLKKWYTAENIVPRLMRFYIPFVPIFILCIIYKIFVLHYEYSVLEAMARFVLGGFKPGSYYVPILAQLVLVFPFVYVFVTKYKEKAVALCVLATLAYDILSVLLGMNDVAYKFLIFRFGSHLALGAYASITNFYVSKKTGISMLVIGVLYSIFCVYTHWCIPPLFFQWQETSFVTALYLYPVLSFVMKKYNSYHYTDSRLSAFTKKLAGATYHVFLVQLMFYTTFGFALNKYVGNYYINIVTNLLMSFVPGVIYAHWSSPFEERIIAKVKKCLQNDK